MKLNLVSSYLYILEQISMLRNFMLGNDKNYISLNNDKLRQAHGNHFH